MKNDERFLTLRRKAESLLKEIDSTKLRDEFNDIEKLLEELNIHQIELEMQQQELLQANEKITSEQKKYKALYMDAPVAYFTLNRTGNIIELNHAAADMLKTPIHKFKYTSIFPYLEEPSRKLFSRYFKQLFSSGTLEQTELVFISAKNERVITRLQAVTYYDQDHREELVRCTASDLTRVREYESELAYQKSVNETIARYEAIFSGTSAGIGITDHNGIIVECNEAFIALLGFSREDMYGKSIQEFNHPDDIVREEDIITGLTPEKPQTRLEKRYITRTGETLWADVTVTAIFSDHQEPYYVGILTNINEQMKARQTIQQLNNRVDASLRVGNMAWWEMELPSGKVAFNERKATMLGYDPKDFKYYTDFMDLVHPEDCKNTMQAFQRHLDGTADTYECEYRIRNAGGDYQWFHDIGKITGNTKNKKTFTGIVTEVTKLKQIREELKRFRLAVDHSSDQVFLIDRESMLFVDANETACLSLGYSREELLRLGPADIKPDYSAGDLEKELDKVIQDPASTGIIETRHVGKSGREIPVEVRLRSMESDGKTIVIAVARDMTEKKQAEEALKAANHQFLTILENIQVGILVISRTDHVILYVNPYMQTFYDSSIEGKRCFDIFGYKNDLCPFCVAGSSRTEAAHQSEEDIPASEYHVPEIGRWFLRQVKTIQWVDGNSAALLILTDITAMKEVDELRDDIERITRHDLKNPLNGILGGTQLLLLDSHGSLTKDQKEFVKMIESSGKRMLTMIDQSLGLYKMEKGLYQVKEEPVNLEKLINSILWESQPEMDELGIRVDLERNYLPDGKYSGFTARGENLLCYSIFSNLVRNALDASEKHDRIKIVYGKDRDNDMVSVSIWNRAAIPEEIRGKFGTKYSTWGKRRGTGLGVYSAVLMTQTQGGHLTWNSSEERGTTIIITLPAG